MKYYVYGAEKITYYLEVEAESEEDALSQARDTDTFSRTDGWHEWQTVTHNFTVEEVK